MKISESELCLDYIQQLNTEYLSIETKPWSFLESYNMYDSTYDGVTFLIEDTYDMENLTVKDKRSFRNLWESLWKFYGEALSLDDSLVTLISNFGLRLAFIQSSDEIVRKVRLFYNDIIGWYLYTKNYMTDEQVEPILETLVMEDVNSLRRYWIGTISNTDN